MKAHGRVEVYIASEPLHYVEAIGQLHAPAASPPRKQHPVYVV
jgi:hypothetical protein